MPWPILSVRLGFVLCSQRRPMKIRRESYPQQSSSVDQLRVFTRGCQRRVPNTGTALFRTMVGLLGRGSQCQRSMFFLMFFFFFEMGIPPPRQARSIRLAPTTGSSSMTGILHLLSLNHLPVAFPPCTTVHFPFFRKKKLSPETQKPHCAWFPIFFPVSLFFRSPYEPMTMYNTPSWFRRKRRFLMPRQVRTHPLYVCVACQNPCQCQ